jgi:hypothetical protein
MLGQGFAFVKCKAGVGNAFKEWLQSFDPP